MTRKEFDELYLGKVVWCKTEELANEFLRLADSVGYKWVDKVPLLNNNYWSRYKNETCYLVRKKAMFMFCSREWFYKEGYTIVEFKDDRPITKLIQVVVDFGFRNNNDLFKPIQKAIDRIVYNTPASVYEEKLIKLVVVNEKKRQVIIKWADNTETKSVCSKDDDFSVTVGFAIAFTRKFFKNDKKLIKFIEKKLPKYKPKKKKNKKVGPATTEKEENTK